MSGAQSVYADEVRKIGEVQPSKPIVPEMCLEHIWTENVANKYVVYVYGIAYTVFTFANYINKSCIVIISEIIRKLHRMALCTLILLDKHICAIYFRVQQTYC